jgi:dephospho-CoA kinase
MTERDRKDALTVGLTGGIASGKTTVSNLFAELGATVIDTDIIAREVVQPGKVALDEIRERFGDTIIDASGKLDRIAMRKLIFSDDQARRDLEAILHPRIAAETRRQIESTSGPYQIVVVPLLVGSSLMQFLDRILVVDCDEETQIRRLLARDTETIEQARKILSAQASRQARLAIADDVLVNTEGLAECKTRVRELDQLYRRISPVSDLPVQSPETL